MDAMHNSIKLNLWCPYNGQGTPIDHKISSKFPPPFGGINQDRWRYHGIKPSRIDYSQYFQCVNKRIQAGTNPALIPVEID